LDNLTHTLTGLMLARAGIRDLVPRAGLLMMAAANAPDIDVFWSWLGGTAFYLRHHRGFTHSLAFSPLLALLPVAIVWLVERKRSPRKPLPWIRLALFSWFGILTHLAFDFTNVYGIRLFLPFSSAWPRLDTVNVLDLFIWALLLLGVAAPALGRLVSTEIGAKPGRGSGWAIFVLLMLLVYEGGRYVAHDRALRALDARIYEGAAPLRVAAFALTANPFAWRGVVETSDAYIIYSMNILEEFDPGAGRTYYKAPASPAIDAAKKTGPFDSLIQFSSYPLWQITPVSDPQGAQRVQLIDLRFGTPVSPGLAASAIVDAVGNVRETALGFGGIQPK